MNECLDKFKNKKYMNTTNPFSELTTDSTHNSPVHSPLTNTEPLEVLDSLLSDEKMDTSGPTVTQGETIRLSLSPTSRPLPPTPNEKPTTQNEINRLTDSLKTLSGSEKKKTVVEITLLKISQIPDTPHPHPSSTSSSHSLSLSSSLPSSSLSSSSLPSSSVPFHSLSSSSCSSSSNSLTSPHTTSTSSSSSYSSHLLRGGLSSRGLSYGGRGGLRNNGFNNHNITNNKNINSQNSINNTNLHNNNNNNNNTTTHTRGGGVSNRGREVFPTGTVPPSLPPVPLFNTLPNTFLPTHLKRNFTSPTDPKVTLPLPVTPHILFLTRLCHQRRNHVETFP